MGTTFLKLVSRPPEARKLQPHLNAQVGALRTVRQFAYPSNSLLVVVSPVSSDHGGKYVAYNPVALTHNRTVRDTPLEVPAAEAVKTGYVLKS